MGIRIQTNVISLSAQHKLIANDKKLVRSLERLSSGLQINRGSDNVVGLLKSESLRSQVRGIASAELGISSAQNLLGVAEGALSQLTDVAQRMRELIVQAADNSISSADRDNLATATDDLFDEYNRLAAAADFDGVKLLDGTFQNKTFQVGPNSVDQLTFSIDDVRGSAIGKVAVVTSHAMSVSTGGLGGTTPTIDTMSVLLNGTPLNTADFADDGVSYREGTQSSIAWVSGINSVSGQSGVMAYTRPNVITWNYTTAGADPLSSAMLLKVNGVAIDQTDYAADDTGAQSFITAVNEITGQTGVTASIDTSSNIVTLTATDSRNIELTYTGLNGADNNFILGYTAFNNQTEGAIINVGEFVMYSDEPFVAYDVDGGEGFSGSFVDSTALSYINLDTAGNAQSSLTIMDSVIRQLQKQRSSVGSKTIRLEAASNEIETRKQNLTVSESIIRDTDFAEETARMTSAQILQQASIFVLARSGGLSQIALMLVNSGTAGLGK